MIELRVRPRFVTLAAATVVALLSVGVASAQSPPVLFYEDFADAELAPNSMLFVNDDSTAVVENGVAKIADATDRSGFSVVQPVDQPLIFDEPLMTFQFDFTETIVPDAAMAARMEVILRAGAGEAHRTLSSGEQVVEAISFRGTDAAGSRIGEMIESKTVFLAYNNKDSEQTFTSPVDGSEVLLLPYQYVPYTLERTSMVFTGQPKGVSNPNPAAEIPPRDITRFAIGSSTSADRGTFSIDNVLVRTGIVFDRNFPGTPSLPLVGDFNNSKVVDAADLAVWKTNFGAGAGADADKDGDSDGNDFLLWQQNLGAAAPAIAAVPEPSALLMAISALLAGLGRRRRRDSN